MDAVCSNYGAYNRNSAKFCAVCGRPLSAGSSSSPPTGLAYPLATPVPLQPVLPQPPMPPPQSVSLAHGAPVDVILCRKAGSGNVRLGDVVRVRGKKQRGNVVRAHEVHVYDTGGHPTDYTIQSLKPWPIWTGLIALGATVGAILYFGVQIGLLN